MHHPLAYFVAGGINDVNVSLAAVADPSFTVKNSNFIFTDDFNMIAAYYGAASALRLRFNVPTFNAIGFSHIYPINRSLLPPANVNVMDVRDYPVLLPQNEELALQESNNLGAATENSYAVLFLAPPGWNRNIPGGLQRMMLRATAAVTLTANSWCADTALAFETTIKGGWYWVVGGECICTNGIAFRMNFPRMKLVNTRKLFPGWLVRQAVSDVHPIFSGSQLGTWGKFNSFEPPSVSILGNTAGAQTAELRLDVIFAGSGEPSFGGM